MWKTVQEAAREAGRDPATMTTRKLLYAELDADKERALRTLGEFLAPYYGPTFPVDQEAVYGGPEEMAATIRAFGEAGCQTVALGTTDLDVAKLERIASEVAPLLG